MRPPPTRPAPGACAHKPGLSGDERIAGPERILRRYDEDTMDGRGARIAAGEPPMPSVRPRTRGMVRVSFTLAVSLLLTAAAILAGCTLPYVSVGGPRDRTPLAPMLAPEVLKNVKISVLPVIFVPAPLDGSKRRTILALPDVFMTIEDDRRTFVPPSLAADLTDMLVVSFRSAGAIASVHATVAEAVAFEPSIIVGGFVSSAAVTYTGRQYLDWVVLAATVTLEVTLLDGRAKGPMWSGAFNATPSLTPVLFIPLWEDETMAVNRDAEAALASGRAMMMQANFDIASQVSRRIHQILRGSQ